MRTNFMRILDTLGIHYEIQEYEVDPDDLSAERIAGDIGLPAGLYVKAEAKGK
jgi:Cys-tRNA(Pro)/Cys-tRNA(Cys) deacylase